MSALLRKSLYFLTLLATIFILYIPVFAQNDPGSIKFKDFYPPTIVLSPTRTPANQVLSPTPTPREEENNEGENNGKNKNGGNDNGNDNKGKAGNKDQNFIHFSQIDSKWIYYNPATVGKIGRCGCGETSVAMILATFLDDSKDPDNGDYNPRKIWDAFEKIWPGRCGTGFTNHRIILSNFNFFASADNIYFTGSQQEKEESNQVIKNYINDGYKIILYFRWQGKDLGHYVVVEEVKGNTLYVHDPLRLSKPAAPIESNIDIKSFIAVKKKK